MAGRKLATIAQVGPVARVANADSLEVAQVRGWYVVTALGEVQEGDLVVYFEIDSLLNTHDERFAFLAPRGSRTTVEGHTGHVLKTARLRGQDSQGLVLPVSKFPELGDVDVSRVGEDVTDALNARSVPTESLPVEEAWTIEKWDPPLPASLAGAVWGNRPHWIPVTDEERIQNMGDILAVASGQWVATEKVDGTSTTFWIAPEGLDEAGEPLRTEGVCSRNLDLREVEGNTLWRIARKLDVHARLRDSGLGERVALQGETFGEGIQANPLKLRGQHFAAFTVVVDGKRLARSQWPQWIVDLSVPLHEDLSLPATVEEALTQVDKLKSKLAPQRAAEGVVWRSQTDPVVTLPSGMVVDASFKAISNSYLRKNDR